MAESRSFHERRPYKLGGTRSEKGNFFADVVDRFDERIATVKNSFSAESAKLSAERMADVFNKTFVNPPR